MKKAKFETLVSNIKLLRNKFKDLNIHIKFVANQIKKTKTMWRDLSPGYSMS